MTSKVFQCLFMIAALGLGTVAVPQPVEARSFPARHGSSAFQSDATCWSPFAATVTNTCPSKRFWTVPLLLDGTQGWVSVVAEGASVSNTVLCRAIGTDMFGNIVTNSGWFSLPQFGAPSIIQVFTSVPGGGTAMIDCDVFPGGKVHTVNW